MAKAKGFRSRASQVEDHSDKGKERNSVLTMEVTTLRKEPVVASTFELPAGYEERLFLPGIPPPEQQN